MGCGDEENVLVVNIDCLFGYICCIGWDDVNG